MSDRKHSPLPWKVDDDGHYVSIFGADDFLVTEGVDRQDAHLIARAVNAHDELLSELKHLVRLLEPAMNNGRAQVPGLATLNLAHMVIAKAEGK